MASAAQLAGDGPFSPESHGYTDLRPRTCKRAPLCLANTWQPVPHPQGGRAFRGTPRNEACCGTPPSPRESSGRRHAPWRGTQLRPAAKAACADEALPSRPSRGGGDAAPGGGGACRRKQRTVRLVAPTHAPEDTAFRAVRASPREGERRDADSTPRRRSSLTPPPHVRVPSRSGRNTPRTPRAADRDSRVPLL